MVFFRLDHLVTAGRMKCEYPCCAAISAVPLSFWRAWSSWGGRRQGIDSNSLPAGRPARAELAELQATGFAVSDLRRAVEAGAWSFLPAAAAAIDSNSLRVGRSTRPSWSLCCRSQASLCVIFAVPVIRRLVFPARGPSRRSTAIALRAGRSTRPSWSLCCRPQASLCDLRRAR